MRRAWVETKSWSATLLLATSISAITTGVASAQGADPQAPKAPSAQFGGQYRVNAYSARAGDGSDQQTATRVRIRQNVDLQFSEQFKTHLQVELGHTDSNRITTAVPVRVRHALIDYTFQRGPGFQAGIVPVGDHFQDTLFSSNWDYNPVALSVTGAPWGTGQLRAFAAILLEGVENDGTDDLLHYQLDYVLPLSEGSALNLGATLVTAEGADGSQHIHVNYGLGGSWRVHPALSLRGFVVGSQTSAELIGGEGARDAYGVAARLEVLADVGIGLLATYATGRDDGRGFLPPMAFAGTYGYWGYTGLLTVQGPTDTGFDGEAVNISNNGLGLATVQLKYAHSLVDSFGIHVAAGWFGGAHTPGDRGSFLGVDFLLMATYRFTDYLALDAGVAYARLADAVSGYARGLQVALEGEREAFNLQPGEDRDKLALFSRLQAEFW